PRAATWRRDASSGRNNGPRALEGTARWADLPIGRAGCRPDLGALTSGPVSTPATRRRDTFAPRSPFLRTGSLEVPWGENHRDPRLPWAHSLRPTQHGAVGMQGPHRPPCPPAGLPVSLSTGPLPAGLPVSGETPRTGSRSG